MKQSDYSLASHCRPFPSLLHPNDCRLGNGLASETRVITQHSLNI